MITVTQLRLVLGSAHGSNVARGRHQRVGRGRRGRRCATQAFGKTASESATQRAQCVRFATRCNGVKTRQPAPRPTDAHMFSLRVAPAAQMVHAEVTDVLAANAAGRDARLKHTGRQRPCWPCSAPSTLSCVERVSWRPRPADVLPSCFLRSLVSRRRSPAGTPYDEHKLDAAAREVPNLDHSVVV